MRSARRGLALVVILAAGIGGVRGSATAQDPIDRIREADLQADLFLLAGDAMRGREGGTLDELKASMWIAERARAIGLQPAGDNDTYFQFFPFERFRVSASSPVTLGGKEAGGRPELQARALPGLHGQLLRARRTLIGPVTRRQIAWTTPGFLSSR